MKNRHASTSIHAAERAAVVRGAGMPTIKTIMTTTWTRGASG
jgi:hypothetical protein